jgi:(5-formylfuran-3-yl)methyl phosphate synthase
LAILAGFCAATDDCRGRGAACAVTRMLASVSGPEEAEIVLNAGADIIDLKDPARGALGALEPARVCETVAAVAGRRPVSAVTGDTPMEPEHVRAAVRAMAACGVMFVKQGIYPGGDAAACIRALAPMAAKVKLVAVMFADLAPDLTLLPVLREVGFAGCMLDTASKGNGRLLDHMDVWQLGRFVEACYQHDLFSGLAGGLELPDIPRLLLLAPGYLGFRTALCGEGGRTAGVEREATQAVRALIPPETAERSAGVDHRLLAARGYAPRAESESGVHDRVFVRDLVLPISIGAYAHERKAPQRVRFDVEVLVARGGRATQDMRDVFSYDVISDGIRLLIGEGHIPLVEMLAERIAAMLLGYPRVVKVAVRLEKLDTGSGCVGVAIERTRGSAEGSAALPRIVDNAQR